MLQCQAAKCQLVIADHTSFTNLNLRGNKLGFLHWIPPPQMNEMLLLRWPHQHLSAATLHALWRALQYMLHHAISLPAWGGCKHRCQHYRNLQAPNVQTDSNADMHAPARALREPEPLQFPASHAGSRHLTSTSASQSMAWRAGCA